MNSPLSLRTQVVKSIVDAEFAHVSEIDRRAIETTILHVLAPIFSPLSTTLVEANDIFRIALVAKDQIDASEGNKHNILRPVPRKAASVLRPIFHQSTIFWIVDHVSAQLC